MKKYLGQHFLINKSKLNKIVEALELKDSDVVIEIGPGHGEITREIGERGKGKGIRIIAIEKDKYLAKQLSEIFQFPPQQNPEQIPSELYGASKFATGQAIFNSQSISNVQFSKNSVQIIIGDVLKVLPDLVDSILGTSDVLNINDNFRTSDVQKLKIVGNIPYYITGYLLRILGELENKPSLIVLTIQKEVAERICGMPFDKAQGKPKMNILAASVQFWAKPEIIGYVSKKDFRPMPKVNSAIIRLKVKGEREKEEEAQNYYKFIKILFKQPRKTITNNLRPTTNNQQLLFEKLKKAGVAPNARPQELSLEQILRLGQFFRVF